MLLPHKKQQYKITDYFLVLQIDYVGIKELVYIMFFDRTCDIFLLFFTFFKTFTTFVPLKKGLFGKAANKRIFNALSINLQGHIWRKKAAADRAGQTTIRKAGFGAQGSFFDSISKQKEVF